jgi:MtN3 and saliva related transmembrane protein
MDATMWIGLAAGFLTTISFVPQIQKILKSRSAEDISRRMFLAIACGVALWLIYGIILGQWPIIIWNAVSLALAGTILFLKQKYG